MLKRLRSLVLLATLVLATSASAVSDEVARLAERLRGGEDFRVRVQAALELGKTHDSDAREPLERGLDDENAAVRVAAAAALKVLGDRRAIPALERHERDASPAVRSQIKTTLEVLRGKGASSDKPRVLVKLGSITAKGRGQSLRGQVESASRSRLSELPGVSVLDPDADAKSEGERAKLPVVMVTGSLRKLNEAKEGGSVVYSASVEFIMHKMPEQSIAATVTGSASTRASAKEAKDGSRADELRRTVITAAVDSAMRRASAALSAASKR